ncbi:putative MaoC like domain protein [marine gamma proteobacterium HTCC2148]|jgi:acyl dehydratase|uniref:Acyl dehydratase n=1 Tax=Candidatus Seongchinamella marina TaxID=2518990 RepID=A0ABT3SSE3_9GAMM|nr:MaoC/PaaZ C-terminal domain-containing protein [Candidatus Seongchinamella marina]EEB78474.1 putative MaoC like domain protein [marine gamma proteobacterium HTCC2148]MCX2972912.1 acyl dehydratase [Candidatus Seongchinamella marina]
MSEYQTLSCADVSVGDKLPPLDIDISSGLIVGGALATRDFEPVHHDKSVAQASGLPDVFMNILTSQGLMSRFVTDWSGPDASIKSLDLKLGAPNVPGMVMTITGEVTEKDDSTGEVNVAVLGENNIWGMHMQGTVKLALPQEG